ncbi:hypothetical protein FN846DRAFT_968781 [Sphaerosporella brunnea]|uniref:Histone transcription regulator 3 homolog n=1 Tax=Sphaerosporella brunnea TaxID=1250544 RepID=A0A5J5EIV8_9PEZI|nr:hypothetical protein FN846DRAFT_968781 [Sphaerosporella brunnea]
MASFTPLNVIPDSDSECEVDNTQEIQIEEALKLYQQALRLHTDRQWEEAQKAYDELFESEIFHLDVEEQVLGRTSNVASSLPLVHYLSFKNQGTFKLDRLKATISTEEKSDVQSAVTQALEWFATALDRDAGDVGLWRQSAQLAIVLSSARLARFTLESVLDHETVGVDASKDALSLVAGGNPNPEDHLALLQLRKILETIGDTLSLSSERFMSLEGKKLNKKFLKFLNPIPWLPVPSDEEQSPLSAMLEQFSERRNMINVSTRTWAAVGRAILDVLPGDDDDIEDIALPPHSGVLQIQLPYDSEENSRDTSPDQPSPEDAAKSENAPADDNEDVAMTDASVAVIVASDRRRSSSANRKRKSTSMGVDTSESGRSRLSKRQRDKKAADAAAAEAAASTPESKAKVRQDTQDEKLFNTVDDCFSSFGLSLGTASALKINFNPDAMYANDGEKSDLYLEDFKTILQTWDDDKGNVILYGDGIQSPAEAAQGMSFLDLEANIPNRPLLVADEGLRKWVKGINLRGLGASQATFEWLKTLCRRDVDSRNKKSKIQTLSSGTSSWTKHNWPDFLKTTVLAAADKCEAACFQYFKDVIEELETRSDLDNFTLEDYADVEFAETVLELYLDDLAATERNRSGSDNICDPELIVRRQRAKRWWYLVGDLMHHRPRDSDGQLEEDQLTLRYLWATSVIAGFSGELSREFRLECFEDLKTLLTDKPPIDLPNSGVMPEISAARAEREISKLKTVDFFSTIFAATSETNERSPEEVIDILEAVLDPGAVLPYDEEEERILHEIGRFLDGSSAMFKLHLWEKLRVAYEKVGDYPRVLSCTLKCIQVVMGELKSRTYVDSSQDHRLFVLLRSLRLVKSMMSSALTLAKDERNVAALSGQELTDAVGSILLLLRILHCYTFWESAVMKGEAKASDLHSYRLVVMKLRELLVQCWIMTYRLYASMLERGMGLEKDSSWMEGEKEEKLAGLLRDVHEELGARHYCKLANQQFLRLMFDELLRFNNPDYDSDFLQVIHCRFHLTLCADQWYFFDHKTIAEPLDKISAFRLVDFIMSQATKKKILQLQKSDLKTGLDKLVEVFGIPRAELSPPRIAHNYGVIESYLVTTLNPLRMFGCLKGELDISTVEISGERKQLASKGLFFLQGKISLFQMKHNKKIGSVRLEELEAALRYLKHDLACNPDSWETWYRLGQAYEVRLEDAQTWSAEFLNTRKQELVVFERMTILSYMMAVSQAIRYADDSPETRKTISELYTDFGYRIYSSSRPPMGHQCFLTEGYDRYFSGRDGQGMYLGSPHKEMSPENALRYALELFKRALDDGADNWKNHYMIGKCMAKLSTYREYEPEGTLQCFVDAIKLCPEKSNETIFEPHHKLISSTTKFVLQDRLSPEAACEILGSSRFSKGIEPVTTREDFILFATEVLKKIRAADKQKWHHRMTYRIARLRYEELQDVASARAEMGSLFSSKAAQLAIWKPEHERPGRHFVFGRDYTLFYTELLEETQDRQTLEALAKRVRRVIHGMFQHNEVWGTVFTKYINVLRAGIPYRLDDEVFRDLSFDEFTTYSQKLDSHCNGLKDSQSPALDHLREVFELRKLNGGLAKNPAIDDLLADSYAKLWQEQVPAIMEAENEKQHNPMSLKNMMFDAAPPPAPPPAAPASSGAIGCPAEAGKMDLDLPLRGKMTRVTRRELISKATNLCKEMNQQPNTIGATKSGSAVSNVEHNPASDDGYAAAASGAEMTTSMVSGDEGTGEGVADYSILPNITGRE